MEQHYDPTHHHGPRHLGERKMPQMAPATTTAVPSSSPAAPGILLGSPIWSKRVAPMMVPPPPTSVVPPPLKPISKDLLALDLAPSSRPPSRTNNVNVTVSVQIQQQRLQAIDDEMKEVNQRISELQHKAIQDQMKYMQDVFSRRFVAKDDPKGVVVVQQAEEEEEAATAPVEKITSKKDTEVALCQPKHVLHLKEQEEETTETTDMIDSAEDDEDHHTNNDSSSDEPQSKGSFKQTIMNFGRRPTTTSSRKSPAIRTMKKAFVARMDQEIATMRDELRELEIAGSLPSDNDQSSNYNKMLHNRSRSGSPSWRSMLRKKSPPRKKARNRSPDR